MDSDRIIGATASNPNDETTGRDLAQGWLGALWRRRWLVVPALVVAPLAAFFVSTQQEPQYQATARVLVETENRAARLLNVGDPAGVQDSERYVKTQASLAREPAVVAIVAAESDVPASVVDDVEVAADTDANVINFRVVDANRARAARLASTYAEAFVAYREQADEQLLSRAREQITTRIAELRRSGGDETDLYENLLEREQELRTLATIGTTNVSVLRRPEQAIQVGPRPWRAAAIGLAAGLVVALALVGIAEASDTRVRSARDVGRYLGAPLLGSVPRAARRRGRTLVMLEAPRSADADAYRMLRANVELALGDAARTLAVTSTQGTFASAAAAANLALALARSGRPTLLVDADLDPRPLDAFFDTADAFGFADVVAGAVDLDEAVIGVDLGRGAEGAGPDARVAVLAAGSLRVHGGDLLSARRLDALIEELRRRPELVIVNAPPLLERSDAVAVSSLVDGVVVAVELGVARREQLLDLRTTLDTLPSATIGVMVIGPERESVRRPQTELARFGDDVRGRARVA